MPDPNKGTQEEHFRSSLQDVLVVLQKLAPYCSSPEELTEMVEYALASNAQLRLLFSVVSRQEPKR